MRFKYCPDCGELLTAKELGDEGLVPWCDKCKRPWFDMFSSCIIALVYNEENEIALLRQNYISTKYRNLVSGYMKPGESAEECAVREIQEEIGMEAECVEPVGTWWFGKKDMLMLGFFVKVRKETLKLSVEVDGADWTKATDAIRQVHPEGSVSHALVKLFLNGRQ